MSANHRFLKLCRTVHLYLGVFTAPAVLFFALTGGLQTFSLHETTRGSSYTPPAWLATVALLHKKQTTTAPPKRPRPAEAPAAAASPALRDPSEPAPVVSGGGSGSDVTASRPGGRALSVEKDHEPPTKNLLPMKIFFALVAVALALSTLTGVYMAYRYSRKPRLVSSILVLGILVPLALLLV
ncbi:MAG: hypothetical protein WDW36_008475 [Sanguina aurantia]